MIRVTIFGMRGAVVSLDIPLVEDVIVTLALVVAGFVVDWSRLFYRRRGRQGGVHQFFNFH